MTGVRRGLASFARAVEALEPYLGHLVFVGGWAHYLYTLRPEASALPFEPLRTEDANVAAPARLARGKQTIAECLTKAGFQEHLSSDHTPPISEYVLGDEAGGFYLEFLAPLVGGEVKRGGRRDVTTRVGGVTAQTLRHVDILLTASWQVTVTRDGGFPVARPRTISIPNPAISDRNGATMALERDPSSVPILASRAKGMQPLDPPNEKPLGCPGVLHC